ncbi:NAD(P)-binding Rossmann-fold superfamily protein [Wolffia australiana]
MRLLGARSFAPAIVGPFFPSVVGVSAVSGQVSVPCHFPRRPISSYPATRYRVKCSYAASNVGENFSTAPIDVDAEVKTERIVVLGGNGFVGSAICKAAVSKGIEVVSVSRSGRPSYSGSWVDQVTWVTGDVFYVNWDEVLVGATAVVSTLGGFGSNEQMKKINGEANILAVDAAKNFGVPKFILISVHDYNLPPFLLSSGYFTGKRSAESEVLSKYPNSGVVLRPGFIYGKRKVEGFEVPLDVVGEPLEKLLKATESFTKPLNSLPASDLLLAPPVSVDDVAFAVVNAIVDDDFFGVFNIEQIKEAATKARKLI